MLSEEDGEGGEEEVGRGWMEGWDGTEGAGSLDHDRARQDTDVGDNVGRAKGRDTRWSVDGLKGATLWVVKEAGKWTRGNQSPPCHQHRPSHPTRQDRAERTRSFCAHAGQFNLTPLLLLHPLIVLAHARPRMFGARAWPWATATTDVTLPLAFASLLCWPVHTALLLLLSSRRSLDDPLADPSSCKSHLRRIVRLADATPIIPSTPSLVIDRTLETFHCFASYCVHYHLDPDLHPSQPSQGIRPPLPSSARLGMVGPLRVDSRGRVEGVSRS